MTLEHIQLRKRKRKKLRRINGSLHRFRRNVRWRLWRAAPFCWYCGRFLFWGDTTIDHLTPRAKGGGEDEANLKLCCWQCNFRKDDLPIELIVCSIQRGRALVTVSEDLIKESNRMSNTTVCFNYQLLKARDRKATQSHAAEIHGLLARSTVTIIDIGRHLQAAHSTMEARLFLSWVRAEFQWSNAQAFNYIRVAIVFRDAKNITRFQPSAVVQLSRKHVDRRAIAAAVHLADAGEVVTWRQALALIAKYAPPRPAQVATAPEDNGRTQESSARSDTARTDAQATGASGGRPSPHSATTASPIDAAEQWRLGLEVLCQLCEQPLKIPRADIEVLADQLLGLALHLRTLSRNVPAEPINGKARKSASAAGRGKRRSPVRSRRKAVA
jgi:hypothetical protein